MTNESHQPINDDETEEKEKDERIDVKVMGVVLGDADGWDGNEENQGYYDFQPNAQWEPVLPKKEVLWVNMTNGTLKVFDDNGTVIWQMDNVQFINHLAEAIDH